MGLLLPLLLVGGLVAVAAGGSKPAVRGLNPDGFITDNIYEMMPGDENVNTTPRFPVVLVVALASTVDDVADVIEDLAGDEYDDLFFVILAKDNGRAIVSALGGDPDEVDYPVGTALVVNLGPDLNEDYQELVGNGLEPLRMGLIKLLDWYDQQPSAMSTGGARGLKSSSSTRTRSGTGDTSLGQAAAQALSRTARSFR